MANPVTTVVGLLLIEGNTLAAFPGVPLLTLFEGTEWMDDNLVWLAFRS